MEASTKPYQGRSPAAGASSRTDALPVVLGDHPNVPGTAPPDRVMGEVRLSKTSGEAAIGWFRGQRSHMARAA